MMCWWEIIYLDGVEISIPDCLLVKMVECGSAEEGSWLMEKEMAAHSSILAWRIPRTGEPRALQPTGLQKSQTGLSHWTTTTLVRLDTTVTLCKYMYSKYFLQAVACYFISFSRAKAFKFIKKFFKWSVLFVSYLGNLSTFYLEVFYNCSFHI